jgi:hypothetical protein
LQPFSKYYIYDLPEVEALIEKMMRELKVTNVKCLSMEDPLPEENIDLFISNYAFSECSRTTQLNYFERVIIKSHRGYVIYNRLAARVYALDCLTPLEFITLLKENGMDVKVYNEPIATDIDNLLIVWNKAQSHD